MRRRRRAWRSGRRRGFCAALLICLQKGLIQTAHAQGPIVRAGGMCGIFTRRTAGDEYAKLNPGWNVAYGFSIVLSNQTPPELGRSLFSDCGCGALTAAGAGGRNAMSAALSRSVIPRVGSGPSMPTAGGGATGRCEVAACSRCVRNVGMGFSLGVSKIMTKPSRIPMMLAASTRGGMIGRTTSSHGPAI